MVDLWNNPFSDLFKGCCDNKLFKGTAEIIQKFVVCLFLPTAFILDGNNSVKLRNIDIQKKIFLYESGEEAMDTETSNLVDAIVKNWQEDPFLRLLDSSIQKVYWACKDEKEKAEILIGKCWQVATGSVVKCIEVVLAPFRESPGLIKGFSSFEESFELGKLLKAVSSYIKGNNEASSHEIQEKKEGQFSLADFAWNVFIAVCLGSSAPISAPVQEEGNQNNQVSQVSQVPTNNIDSQKKILLTELIEISLEKFLDKIEERVNKYDENSKFCLIVNEVHQVLPELRKVLPEFHKIIENMSKPALQQNNTNGFFGQIFKLKYHIDNFSIKTGGVKHFFSDWVYISFGLECDHLLGEKKIGIYCHTGIYFDMMKQFGDAKFGHKAIMIDMVGLTIKNNEVILDGFSLFALPRSLSYKNFSFGWGIKTRTSSKWGISLSVAVFYSL